MCSWPRHCSWPNDPLGSPCRQRLSALAVVAGFQVSTGGRIWVSTEAASAGRFSCGILPVRRPREIGCTCTIVDRRVVRLERHGCQQRPVEGAGLGEAVLCEEPGGIVRRGRNGAAEARRIGGRQDLPARVALRDREVADRVRARVREAEGSDARDDVTAQPSRAWWSMCASRWGSTSLLRGRRVQGRVRC